MQIKEHEPLRLHTTLRTGGPARYFVEATTEDELAAALSYAATRALPVFVLGGGSNVLVSDDGFKGMVIHLATRGIQINDAGSTMELIVAAGEEWEGLVACAVARGLHGLENLSLIPGSVGGAVAGNIGAYGAEVQDTLLWADALDPRTGVVRRYPGAECQFGYRVSLFKSTVGRHLIIIRAGFALKKSGVLRTAYQDVQEYLSTRNIVRPTLVQVREAVIEIRRHKLPDLACVGTAGSFFKNPVIARAEYEALAARYAGLPGYDEGNQRVKIPVGWILDKVCGLRGMRQGRVGIHPGQALVIINDGGTAAEVAQLADTMARAVKEKTGIDIAWEVEKVGF